jgi:hypothetical protein
MASYFRAPPPPPAAKPLDTPETPLGEDDTLVERGGGGAPVAGNTGTAHIVSPEHDYREGDQYSGGGGRSITHHFSNIPVPVSTLLHGLFPSI